MGLAFRIFESLGLGGTTFLVFHQAPRTYGGCWCTRSLEPRGKRSSEQPCVNSGTAPWEIFLLFLSSGQKQRLLRCAHSPLQHLGQSRTHSRSLVNTCCVLSAEDDGVLTSCPAARGGMESRHSRRLINLPGLCPTPRPG